MKKIVLAILMIMLLGGTAFSAGNTIGDMASMELGIINGYNLDTTGLSTGFMLGIYFPLANSMEMGFQLIDGDGVDVIDMKLLKFNMYLSKKVGFSVSSGVDAANNLAVGMGLFIDLLKRQTALQTAFQIQVNYLYVDTANEGGTLTLGFAARFGM